MRVVFPTDENSGYLSRRGAHFGRAKFYTVITVEEGKITDVEGVPNPGHSSGACGNAVSNIMNLNPDALVVSGIGATPAKEFAKIGLKVYLDQQSVTVEESVKRLTKNLLMCIEGVGTCGVN